MDVIWVDNLLINFLVLWITWMLSGNTAPMWRLWCSACIGACYVILLILPGFSILSGFPLKVLLSLAMLAVGFRIRTWSVFLKLLGYFYGITFLLGGAAFGFYYFFEAGIQVSQGVFLIRDFPLKIIVFSAIFVILLYRWLWPLLQLRINRGKLVYKVEICFEKEILLLDAFLDTGNDLADPVSGRPVMVVEFDSMKAILPPEIQEIFLLDKEQQLDFVSRVMEKSTWISRFSIVPYRTLGTSADWFPAFRPDGIRIYTEGAWMEARQSLIGIRNRKLSKSEEYSALLQPHMIP